MLKIGFLKFIRATLIGLLPLALLMAWLGESDHWLMTGLSWESAISLVAFIACILYEQRRKKPKQRNEFSSSDNFGPAQAMDFHF
jgi:uncharacterized membrane protein YdjX (TVP38/TMEM64 family)